MPDLLRHFAAWDPSVPLYHGSLDQFEKGTVLTPEGSHGGSIHSGDYVYATTSPESARYFGMMHDFSPMTDTPVHVHRVEPAGDIEPEHMPGEREEYSGGNYRARSLRVTEPDQNPRPYVFGSLLQHFSVLQADLLGHFAAARMHQAAAEGAPFRNTYHGTEQFGGNPEWSHTWFHGTKGEPEFDGRRGHGMDEMAKPPEEREMRGGWAQPNQLLGVHFSPLHEVAHKFAGGGISSTPSAVVHAKLHFSNPAHFESEHHLNIAMADWASKHYPHWHDEKLNGRMGWNYSDQEGTHRDFSHVPDDYRERRRMGDQAQSLLQWHPHMPEILKGFTQHLRDQGHRGITYGNDLEGPYLTDATRGGQASMKFIEKTQDHPMDSPHSISAIAQPGDIETTHVEHISPWREEPKPHERTWEDVSDQDEPDEMRDRVLAYHREHKGAYPHPVARTAARGPERYIAPPQDAGEMWHHLQEAHGVKQSADSIKTPGADFMSVLHSRFHGQGAQHQHEHESDPREPGHNLSQFFTPIPAAEQRKRQRPPEPQPEPLDDREYSIRDVSRHYDWEGFDPHEIEHLVHRPEQATFTKEAVPVGSLRHVNEHGRLKRPPSYQDIASQGDDERERLEELEHGYDQGARIPPIVVVRHGKHHIIADGSHRAAVHAEHGESHIPAFVTQRTIFPERRTAVARPQLDVTDYEGRTGDRSHITRDEHGWLPTSAIAHLHGAEGELPGEHRNYHGPDWDDFKNRISAEGIREPIFITVDHGEEPRISEGNTRRDAAIELGHDRVPVHVRYFGHAEQQGSVHERMPKTAAAGYIVPRHPDLIHRVVSEREWQVANHKGYFEPSETGLGGKAGPGWAFGFERLHALNYPDPSYAPKRGPARVVTFNRHQHGWRPGDGYSEEEAQRSGTSDTPRRHEVTFVNEGRVPVDEIHSVSPPVRASEIGAMAPWAARQARTASIRMVPPEEYSKYDYPDYRYKTLPRLARHFREDAPAYWKALKDHVAANGMEAPVLTRDYGGGRPLRVMDGHHRAAAAYELGLHIPVGDYDNEDDYNATVKPGQDWYREYSNLKTIGPVRHESAADWRNDRCSRQPLRVIREVSAEARTASGSNSGPWYHGTSRYFEPDALISSPASRGVHWDTQQEESDPEQVYFSDNKNVAGDFALLSHGTPDMAKVYEVRPTGEVEDDPHPRHINSFQSKKPLRVVRQLDRGEWNRGKAFHGGDALGDWLNPSYWKSREASGSNGDRYVTCSKGHTHWGANGAAGLLIRHRGEDGRQRYLLQKRSNSAIETDHPDTWSIPGGAIGRDETPEQGAMREAREELGPLPRHLKHHHTIVSTDCGSGGTVYSGHEGIDPGCPLHGYSSRKEPDSRQGSRSAATMSQYGALPASLHDGFPLRSRDRIEGTPARSLRSKRTGIHSERSRDRGLPESAADARRCDDPDGLQPSRAVPSLYTPGRSGSNTYSSSRFSSRTGRETPIEEAVGGTSGRSRHVVAAWEAWLRVPGAAQSPALRDIYGTASRSSSRDAEETPSEEEADYTGCTCSHSARTHRTWQYHTVVMDAGEHFLPRGGGETEHESAGTGWFSPKEVEDLDLHPAFKKSWDTVRRSRGPKTAVRERRWPDGALDASSLGPQYHSTPFPHGFPYDDWVHVGSRSAAESRARNINPEDYGLHRDTPATMHTVRLHGRVYPHMLDDDTASEMWGRGGPFDEIDEGLPSGRGYHVFPYRNETEDKGKPSYLVHRSAIHVLRTETIPRHALGPSPSRDELFGPQKTAVIQPGSLPERQQAAFDAEDHREHRRQMLDVASHPDPGTRVWRGEMRPADEHPSEAKSAGLHWTVNPDSLITNDTGEEGKRRVVWQGVVGNHEEQAFPRSHPIWRGRHQSFDHEAEVRFRPGAQVRLEGAYVAKKPNPGYLVPRKPERTSPDWEWHPLGHHLTIRHAGYGAADYTDVGIPREAARRLPVSEMGPLYHGTTEERARRILSEGFEPSAARQETVHLTPDPELAGRYAQGRIIADKGGTPAVLKVDKVRGVSAHEVGYADPGLARDAGADYMDKGPEVVVLNPSAMHGISRHAARDDLMAHFEAAVRNVPSRDGPDGASKSMMIAVVPPAEVIDHLQDVMAPLGENTEPREKMHLTLLYLGEEDDHPAGHLAKLPELAAQWAKTQPPFKAKVQGTGTFINGDSHVLHALVDIPRGHEIRTSLEGFLHGHGIHFPRDHNFTPHVTLAYSGHRMRFLPKIEPHEFPVDSVWFCRGGRREEVPLGQVAAKL